MIRMLTAVVALLLAAILVLGCEPAVPTALNLTETDSGSAVTVAQGGTITVSLPSNPSTGYSWLVGEVPPFLTQRGGSTFVPSSNSSAAVGAGGTETLVFDAASAGKGELTLSYARAWESTTPEAVWNVTITVP